MSKEEKIKRKLRISLLRSIAQAYDANEEIINIYLCDVDEPTTHTSYQESLKQIKNSGGLADYTLETLLKEMPNIPRPSDLEVEDNPVVINNYHETMQYHKDVEGEPYNSLKILKSEINIEIINNLLQSALITNTKIVVSDGKIFEQNKKILIYKYATDTKAYLVADYLFNEAVANQWISYDEIVEHHEGVEINDTDSIKNQRQAIADAVKGINKHAVAELGYKVIKNDGKAAYKAIR